MLIRLPLALLAIALLLGALAEAPAPQPAPNAVQWCVREWTIYNDGPGDLTFDGPNRHQIAGARYDLRPNANNIGANLNKLREWGIFAYSTPQAPSADILLCVPATRQRVLTNTEIFQLRAGLDNVLLVPGTFPEVMYSLATVWADNANADRAPSLRPTRGGKLNLWVGNDGPLHSESFVLGTHRASASVLGAYQETYRKIRAATLRGENAPDSHRLYLGHLSKQYNTVFTNQFIPKDLPKESALKPQSTISDNFDGGAPGVLLDDFNLDWAVTSSSNDCDVEVQSGADDYVKGAEDGSTCENFAVAGVTTDDHNVEGTFRFTTAITSNAEHFLFARKACGTTTRTWYSWWEEIAPTPEQRIRERTAGSSVTLNNDTSPVAKSADTDYVYKIVVDGSDITGTVDGGESLAASDASITGNLCGGVGLRSSAQAANDSTLDLWSQTDEGAPAVRRFLGFFGF